jgi:hypothetical protein
MIVPLLPHSVPRSWSTFRAVIVHMSPSNIFDLAYLLSNSFLIHSCFFENHRQFAHSSAVGVEMAPGQGKLISMPSRKADFAFQSRRQKLRVRGFQPFCYIITQQLR